MDISSRKKKILAAVIDHYIETAEPVGSKTIAETAGLGLSSATIRNELAELTAMGYLEQPHTSAGRIPSSSGYRLYVNELMEKQRLTEEETEAINQTLGQKMQQLDKMMSDVGKLTSALTQYPAYAMAAPAAVTIQRFDLIYIDTNNFIIVALLSNNTVKNKLVRLPFSVNQDMIVKLSALFNANFTGITDDKITPLMISSTERACGDTYGLVSVIASFALEVLGEASARETYVTGASHLLEHPEFRDPDKASRVMHYISDGSHLTDFPDIPADGEIKVLIGPENIAEELKDSSVVMVSYNAGNNMQGMIGVVGPTRMDYSKVAAKLSYIANSLSHLLSNGSTTPEVLNNMLIKGVDINE